MNAKDKQKVSNDISTSWGVWEFHKITMGGTF